MRRKAIAGLAAVALLFSAAVIFFNLAPQAAALDNRKWGANYFPNVELTDQNGNKVHFYDDLLKGKLVLIDMIYTHCVDSCPLETARLVQVQKTLGDRVGKDIFFYSITLDPKRDTPEALKAYADKYHVGPGWLFLTGKKDDIYLIGEKLGLYSYPFPANSDGHDPGVLLGNEATGQWMMNSAADNPHFLSIMIGNLLDNWKHSVKPTETVAGVADLKLDKGQYMFGTQCSACHTIGHGDKIGPDLLGITNIRDHAWLMRFIQRPNEVLAEGDPIATALFKKYKEVQMPNLRLPTPDAESILKFLADQTAAADPDKGQQKPAEKTQGSTASTSPLAGKSQQ